MKKMLVVCMAVPMLALCIAAGAHAEENDFEFADGVVTGYNGTETGVEIPSEIGGQTVEEIADGAFSDNRIASLTLPETISAIGEYALPDGIDTIHYNGQRTDWEKLDIGVQSEGVYESVRIDVGGGQKYRLFPLRISIPEGLDYTDDGIAVGVRVMYRPSKAGGGYISYDYIGYDGVRNYYPNGESLIMNIPDTYRRLSFRPGETEKDISVTYLSSNQYIYYAVEDDKYFGSGSVKFNSELNSELFPGTQISGTITVPGLADDASFNIAAIEGLRIEDNISVCDFKTLEYGYVNSQTKTANYSLTVKPNTEYTIVADFYDREYLKQIRTVSVGEEPITLDFDDIGRSPVITGAIELPENITELRRIDGTEEPVSGYIYLQSNDAPYQIIDEAEFTITEDERSADFVLHNDFACDAIVYYKTSYDFDGLYFGGNYLDDTKCVSDVSGASALDGGEHEISIKMLGGRIVMVNYSEKNNAQPADFYIEPAEVGETSALHDLSWHYDYFIVPEDLGDYIITAEAQDENGEHIYGRFYYDGEKFTENRADARVYDADTSEIDLYWNVAQGAAVIDLRGKVRINGYDEISITNVSKIPDNAAVIAAAYSGGRLSDTAVVTGSGDAVKLRGEGIDCVKMFCFDGMDTMQPLCEPWTEYIDYIDPQLNLSINN